MNKLSNLTFCLLTVLFSIIFMASVYTIPSIFKELHNEFLNTFNFLN